MSEDADSLEVLAQNEEFDTRTLRSHDMAQDAVDADFRATLFRRVAQHLRASRSSSGAPSESAPTLGQQIVQGLAEAVAYERGEKAAFDRIAKTLASPIAPPLEREAAERTMTPEQLREGLFQARRIIRAAVGFRFAGEVVEFSPIFRSLALRAVDTLEAAALVSPRVEPSCDKATCDGWFHAGALSADLTYAAEARNAWRDAAHHVAGCVECGQTSWETCDEGRALRTTAEQADKLIDPGHGAESRALRRAREAVAPRVETEGDAADGVVVAGEVTAPGLLVTIRFPHKAGVTIGQHVTARFAPFVAASPTEGTAP